MTCLNVRSQNVEEAGFDSSRIRCDTTSQASSLTLALSEGERMWSGTVPNGSPEEVALVQRASQKGVGRAFYAEELQRFGGQKGKT